jgi:hypothetical protein
MSQIVYRMSKLLSTLTEGVPVGTNLDLYLLMWMIVSGRLLASREIILRGLREEIALVVSDLVREETQRNLGEDHPEVLPNLELFWDSVPFEIVNPTKRQVLAATDYTELRTEGRAHRRCCSASESRLPGEPRSQTSGGQS